MALSLETQNLVWQKAKVACAALGLREHVADQLRSLKAIIQARKGNITLQFVAISDLTADVVAADVAARVYAVVLKKQATATDAYFKAFNDAATDSSSDDARIVLPLLEASEQQALTSATGIDFTAGIAIGSYTASTGAAGATASTAGDGPNGFLIIGAE